MEGVIRGSNVGNNAGEGGWRYRGEISIETLDGSRVTLDYLEIKSARNAWTDDKAREYEQRGQIQIIK